MNKVTVTTRSVKDLALEVVKLRKALREIQESYSTGKPYETITQMKLIATEALKK